MVSVLIAYVVWVHVERSCQVNFKLRKVLCIVGAGGRSALVLSDCYPMFLN